LVCCADDVNLLEFSHFSDVLVCIGSSICVQLKLISAIPIDTARLNNMIWGEKRVALTLRYLVLELTIWECPGPFDARPFDLKRLRRNQIEPRTIRARDSKPTTR
jgi:hypothetical protein